MSVICCCEEVLSPGLEPDLDELTPSDQLSHGELLNNFDSELKRFSLRMVVALRETRRFGYELFENLCERFPDELDDFWVRLQLLELVKADVCSCWLEENVREFASWHCLVNVIQRCASTDGDVDRAGLRLVLEIADFLVSMDEGNYQRHLCLGAEEYPDADTFGNSERSDRSTFGLGGHQSLPTIN